MHKIHRETNQCILEYKNSLNHSVQQLCTMRCGLSQNVHKYIHLVPFLKPGMNVVFKNTKHETHNLDPVCLRGLTSYKNRYDVLDPQNHAKAKLNKCN